MNLSAPVLYTVLHPIASAVGNPDLDSTYPDDVKVYSFEVFEVLERLLC